MFEVRPVRIFKTSVKIVFGGIRGIRDLGNIYVDILREERLVRYERTPINTGRQLRLEEVRSQLAEQNKPAFLRGLLLD